MATEQEIQREIEFTDWWFKEHHKAPTYADAIAWADEHPGGSQIKWQTGEPTKMGAYILTTKEGRIAFERFFPRVDKDFFKEFVVAWCHMNDIEPYKEGKNE